jgi:phytoene dehydrogenase-like protein
VIVDLLVQKIKARGGQVLLNTRVHSLHDDGANVTVSANNIENPEVASLSLHEAPALAEQNIEPHAYFSGSCCADLPREVFGLRRSYGCRRPLQLQPSVARANAPSACHSKG